MTSPLRSRVRRLERESGPDLLSGVQEFRFALYTDKLPTGTLIPEGGRIVADFFEEFTCSNWRNKPGLTFRSGFYRERVTTDPDDQGRIIPACEDPLTGSATFSPEQPPDAPVTADATPWRDES